MGAAESYALIVQDPVDGPAVQAILELPNDRWTTVRVAFGTEEFATATVELLLTAEQLVALARAAGKRAQDCVARDDMPGEDELEDALLREARASVALDGDTRS